MPNNIWQKYTLELPFKYAACMHCNALVDSLQNWLPPALIYALNNAKPHNVCNQKCIAAFSSFNSKPRKH